MAFTGSRLVRLIGARQLAFFVTGMILGYLLPQFFLTSELVVPTANDSEVSAQIQKISQSAEQVLKKLWNVKPAKVQFNLTIQPKRLGDRKIVRWAKDEVNMAELIKPLIVWTSDEMTRAMSRTWAGDAAKEVTMFVPESSSSAIRLFPELEDLEKFGFSSGRQIKTFTASLWSSSGGAILLTMETLCKEFELSLDKRKQTLAQFRWFVFGHDYTYIRMDALRGFLRTVSLAKPLVIAYPHAINNDFTTWSSRASFILNQKAMSAVCPYTPHCKEFLGSKEVPDDTVLSLCLKVAGVQGSVASDVQRYLVDVSKELQTALNNHSLSNIAALKDGLVFTVSEPHGLHLLFRADKHSKLVLLNNQLFRAGEKMKEMEKLQVVYPLNVPSPSPASFNMKTIIAKGYAQGGDEESEVPWYSYDSNFAISSDLSGRHGQEKAAAFVKDVENTLNIACRYCAAQEERFHCLDMVSANSRFRPNVGMEYRYDLLVKSLRLPAHEASPQRQIVHLVRPLSRMKITALKHHAPKTVHFLLPIVRKSAQFQAFMAVYEKVVLTKQTSLAALVIICFDNQDEDEESRGSIMEPQSLVALYQHKYPSAQISFVPASQKKFDRAAGLVEASKSLSADALLLFADVDMKFTELFMERCHLATEEGRQMYLPIPFYFYRDAAPLKDSATSFSKPPGGRFYTNNSAGSFQSWSRDVACMYKSDLDTSGWPGNDGTGDELVEKVQHRLQIIESPEPSLAYFWHKRHCSRVQGKAKQSICRKLEAGTAPKA